MYLLIVHFLRCHIQCYLKILLFLTWSFSKMMYKKFGTCIQFVLGYLNYLDGYRYSFLKMCNVYYFLEPVFKIF